jgi:hypothetical protein
MNNEFERIWKPSWFNQSTILTSVWKEVKVVPVRAMKAYGGSIGIPTHIINLGTRGESVAHFMSKLLYLQENSPQY